MSKLVKNCDSFFKIKFFQNKVCLSCSHRTLIICKYTHRRFPIVSAVQGIIGVQCNTIYDSVDNLKHKIVICFFKER